MLDPTIRPTAPPCRTSPAGNPRRTLAVAILGSSMAFLDGSVVNVALPVIQRELRVGVGLAQWIIEGYALFLASLVLVGGALGDRLGRRRVFSAGVVVFALASAACGSAPSGLALVAARAVQGIGAAVLVPGSLSLISAAYPEDARGKAIGIWSTITAAIAAVGPIAGGVVIAHASWRWIFFFNIPIGISILALSRAGVEDTRDGAAPRRMDWPGAALVTLGLGAIVYALIEGGSRIGTRGEAILLGAGIAALVGFVVLESRTTSPMIPLVLFRSRTFMGTNLLTFLLYGALGITLFVLPFELIQVEGYGAAAAGAALLPFVGAVSLLSPVMGALSQKRGARAFLVAGSLVCAGAYVLLAGHARGGSYMATFFPGIALLGIGMGIVVAPLTTAVMGSVGSERSGVASGVNNAVARAAGLVAIAALGATLRARFDRVLDARLAALHLPEDAAARVAAERGKLAAADFTGLDDTIRGTLQAAFGDAYVAGFRAVMLASAVLAALAAVAAWATLRASRSPSKAVRSSGSVS